MRHVVSCYSAKLAVWCAGWIMHTRQLAIQDIVYKVGFIYKNI